MLDLNDFNPVDEEYRTYYFGIGETYEISYPSFWKINENDTHLVIDAQGLFHAIPKGWIGLEIKPRL